MTTSKFKPGQSGNPKGRKPGNATAARLRKMITGDIKDIVAMLIEKAKDGDVQAAKILMDKVCPSLKPQAETVTFPVSGGAGLSETGQAVLNEMSRGKIAPDAGSQILGALSAQAKIIGTTDLIARVEALEGRT